MIERRPLEPEEPFEAYAEYEGESVGEMDLRFGPRSPLEVSDPLSNRPITDSWSLPPIDSLLQRETIELPESLKSASRFAELSDLARPEQQSIEQPPENGLSNLAYSLLSDYRSAQIELPERHFDPIEPETLFGHLDMDAIRDLGGSSSERTPSVQGYHIAFARPAETRSEEVVPESPEINMQQQGILTSDGELAQPTSLADMASLYQRYLDGYQVNPEDGAAEPMQTPAQWMGSRVVEQNFGGDASLANTAVNAYLIGGTLPNSAKDPETR